MLYAFFWVITQKKAYNKKNLVKYKEKKYVNIFLIK